MAGWRRNWPEAGPGRGQTRSAPPERGTGSPAPAPSSEGRGTRAGDPLRPPGPACRNRRKEIMPDPKKPAKSARRSAAMLGNRNALKHGFYARKMIPLELSDLDTALGDGLTDEIALLRVIIRRVFDFSNDHESQTLETWSGSLNTLGAACTRLAGLLRTNQILGGGGPEDTLRELAQAFGFAAHEFGYSDPNSSRRNSN